MGAERAVGGGRAPPGLARAECEPGLRWPCLARCSTRSLGPALALTPRGGGAVLRVGHCPLGVGATVPSLAGAEPVQGTALLRGEGHCGLPEPGGAARAWLPPGVINLRRGS